MPIYEFRCSACDHLTELLLGLNDPPPQFCPSCGAEGTMRKSFAPPAIVFKGSGWAKKDRAATARSSSDGKPESASDRGGGTDASTSKAGSGSEGAAAAPSGSSTPSGSSAGGGDKD